MKKRYWMLTAAALVCLSPLAAIADTYVGTYEVSYIYNSTIDPSNAPVGSAVYNSVATAPLKVVLAPGSYYTKVVSGRIDGNDFFDHGYDSRYVDAYHAFVPVKNPGSVYPATGYNGGCTDPLHGDPADPSSWWSGAYGWVGSSETAGSNVGGTFDILPGQSLWLYWPDPWIFDNLGGTTMEVWQTAGGAATVPEPTSMMLLGLGLAGIAGARRKFKKINLAQSVF